MEFLEIDIENLYQSFGGGVVLGFSLYLVVSLIGGFIHLFKKITKMSVSD